jgi:hypothetical protein
MYQYAFANRPSFDYFPASWLLVVELMDGGWFVVQLNDGHGSSGWKDCGWRLLQDQWLLDYCHHHRYHGLKEDIV